MAPSQGALPVARPLSLPRHAAHCPSTLRYAGEASSRAAATVPAVAHHSDSTAQRDAEPIILAALSSELGVELEPRRLQLPSGAYCDVDGVSPDELVLVEAFARQSKLKGGQRGKIARDALKLMTLRECRPGARLILALADPNIVRSLTAKSWLAEALRTFNIQVLYVEIPADARDKIAAAEIRQVMVNPDAGPAPEPAT
jgi:hypothetical protein